MAEPTPDPPPREPPGPRRKGPVKEPPEPRPRPPIEPPDEDEAPPVQEPPERERPPKRLRLASSPGASAFKRCGYPARITVSRDPDAVAGRVGSRTR